MPLRVTASVRTGAVSYKQCIDGSCMDQWRNHRMRATYCCGGMHRDSGGTVNGERWPTSRCYSVTVTADYAATGCSAEMTCSPPTPTHRAHTVRPKSHVDICLFSSVSLMPGRCMCRRKLTLWFPGLVASRPFQIHLEVPHLLYSMIFWHLYDHH